MALTPSTMVPLGTPLPAFALPALDGTVHNSADLPSRPLLVLFLCAHCPFVKHIEPELARIDRDYGQHITILAIASNSLRTHPQDGPGQLAEQKQRVGWRFPYLLDADQSVARAFRAACTPDIYLFDAAHQLVYRGQLDGSRPGNSQAPDGADLRSALDSLLAGRPLSTGQKPAIGCNIKWHPGLEPAWA
ncbi:thioredoxin family protein [Synechococcus sp. J7-Johnson]|uniref:thioredoxin family protein n=1 Tax=Synechococcus sp. J7-Johnson TaxID=2823737 RepID=UPI0020CC9A4A|nr:thioredoxin family protein [Synechococcus sp. J7-Johnson]MCP9841560.1 thioredoxin family protein [Synechococcus sp. J7-Johnson]